MEKLVVGLGNPGPRYEATRHNVGFWVVDALARRFGVSVGRLEHRALTGRLAAGGRAVLLAKPQTYVNGSGEAVGALARYYRVEPADILVVYDDLHLPTGALRLRPGGSAGGHNGMKSIIAHLGTDRFPRLRIGIGPPPPPEAWAEYVLAPLAGPERAPLEAAVDRAVEAVLCWLEDGIERAMNRFNREAASGGPADGGQQRASAPSSSRKGLVPGEGPDNPG